MNRIRAVVLAPALALGLGLAACAPDPADSYYGAAPVTTGYVAQPGYVTQPGYIAQPGYLPAPQPYATAPGYATPMPSYVGQGEYRAMPPAGAYAAVPADPYCRQAYAAAAGAQQQAAITGSYGDAARAERSAGYYRRDC